MVVLSPPNIWNIITDITNDWEDINMSFVVAAIAKNNVYVLDADYYKHTKPFMDEMKYFILGFLVIIFNNK